MYISLLEKLPVSLSPESRFFLLRLIGLERDGIAPLGVSIKLLARQYGVTEKVVSAAIKELASHGLVVKTLQQGAKGRPANVHAFSETMTKMVHDAWVQSTDHLHRQILQLLIDGRLAKGVDENVLLNNAQRLFLVILLFNANEAGVVDSLSFNRLSKLTGMTRERLKSQLNRLMTLGYIEKYTVGVSCSKIFGRRPGVFFLNISADCYGKYGRPVQACKLQYFCPDDRNVRSVASLVFSAIIDSASNHGCPTQDVLREVSRSTYVSIPKEYMTSLGFIGQTPVDDRVVAYFQYVIFKYAGFWIEQKFPKMNFMNLAVLKEHPSTVFLQPIIDDISPASKHVVGAANSGDIGRLAHLVLYISGQYAKAINKYFVDQELDVASKRIVVLPSETINEERCIRLRLISTQDTSCQA